MSRPAEQDEISRCPLGAEQAPGAGSGASGTEFARYLADDVLLSLQRPRTDSRAEPTFLIVSQVMELLFKLAHTEAVGARDLLERDDVGGALWTLRRLRQVHRLMNSTWHVLGSLTPTEYAEFREQLGDGSGIQSHMYRRLEFVLGNKNRKWMRPWHDDEPARRELERSLHEPSLYDAALRLLSRRGIAVPAGTVERNWGETYREQEAVVEAWRVVYREQPPDLCQLAEALMDLAYDFGQWRSAHLLTVERLLGAKSGTGGTTGVSWLRRAAEQRFFPELWSARTGL